MTSDTQTKINNKANATDLTSLLSKTTDLTYESSTLTTTYGNNVIVNGNINGLTPSRCIDLDYLPTKVSNHSTKLTDISYSTASVTTTIGQNLVVNDLINGAIKSKFPYLNGLTNDIQSQLILKDHRLI